MREKFDASVCTRFPRPQYYEEHESVEESRRLQTEPIDLDTCLHAFTKEEELGEDELYNCSFCKKEVLATKKLDIWRLPPVLVSCRQLKTVTYATPSMDQT